MTKKLKIDKQFLLSPWNMSFILGSLSICFYFIPNQIYQNYVKENANLFLNLKAVFFIFVCSTSFSLSSFVAYKILVSKRVKVKTIYNPAFVPIQIIIFLLTIINIAYLALTLGFSNLLSVYSSGDTSNGNYLKLQLSEAISNGKLGWIGDLCIALIVWSFWVALRSGKKRAFSLLIPNILLSVIVSLISVSRDSVISLVVMLSCIYIQFLISRNMLSIKRVAIVLVSFFALFASTFTLVGLARSSNFESASFEVTKQFMGYFPASYNRLAFVLDGDLKYPDSGWGYYSTQLIWDVPLLSGALGIYSFAREIGLPLPVSSQDNYQRQFTSVKESGLDPSYIWSTIFGFTYSDFGYFAIFYFLIYGVLSGAVYSLFRVGNNFAIIVYPFILASIVKWPSIVSFSQRGLIIFIAAWLIVTFINNLLSEKRYVNAL